MLDGLVSTSASDRLADVQVTLVGASAGVRAAVVAAGALVTDVGVEAWRAAPVTQADVVVVQSVGGIAIRDAGCPVVVIAARDAGLTSLQDGAAGVVTLHGGVEQLIDAVSAVIHGDTYIDRELMPDIVAHLRAVRVARQLSLSDTLLSSREVDIVARVALGQDNREIATALSISPKTVKNHVSNSLAKLGLANRTQLAAYAIHAGFSRQPASENGPPSSIA